MNTVSPADKPEDEPQSFRFFLSLGTDILFTVILFALFLVGATAVYYFGEGMVAAFGFLGMFLSVVYALPFLRRFFSDRCYLQIDTRGIVLSFRVFESSVLSDSNNGPLLRLNISDTIPWSAIGTVDVVRKLEKYFLIFTIDQRAATQQFETLVRWKNIVEPLYFADGNTLLAQMYPVPLLGEEVNADLVLYKSREWFRGAYPEQTIQDGAIEPVSEHYKFGKPIGVSSLKIVEIPDGSPREVSISCPTCDSFDSKPGGAAGFRLESVRKCTKCGTSYFFPCPIIQCDAFLIFGLFLVVGSILAGYLKWRPDEYGLMIAMIVAIPTGTMIIILSIRAIKSNLATRPTPPRPPDSRSP